MLKALLAMTRAPTVVQEEALEIYARPVDTEMYTSVVVTKPVTLTQLKESIALEFDLDPTTIGNVRRF